MIRVNLLRNISAGDEKTSQGYTQTYVATADSPERAMAIKIAIAVIPSLAFFGFRFYKISEVRAELNAVSLKNNQVLAQLETLAPAVKELDRFKEEEKHLKDQLEVIKGLSKERLKVVKSLTAIPDLMPPKAWITYLNISENNKVKIDGLAVDDIVVADFLKNLNASIYYTNVVLTSSEETKTRGGTLKKFGVQCDLENF